LIIALPSFSTRIDYTNQLERSFSKTLYKITKIKIGNLNLKQQLEKLTEQNILPLKLRLFTRLSKSIFNLIKVSKSALAKKFIKNNTAIRTHYLLPPFLSNQGNFSFTTKATKLINDFIFVKLEADNLNFNHVEKKQGKQTTISWLKSMNETSNIAVILTIYHTAKYCKSVL
jgi:hypothetical protein